MARNVKIRQSPTQPVTAMTAAHNSGDLVYEDNVVGVNRDTVAAGAAGLVFHHGVYRVPCPAGVTEGQILYTPTANLVAGGLIAQAPSATASVTTSLQTSSSSATKVGRARRAAYTWGPNTVVDLELSPQ